MDGLEVWVLKNSNWGEGANYSKINYVISG